MAETLGNYYASLADRAEADLRAWKPAQLRKSTVEALSASLQAKYAIPTISWDADGIEWELVDDRDPAGGIRLTIPYEPEGRAQPFLNFIAAEGSQFPAIKERGGRLQVVLPSKHDDVTRTVEAILESFARTKARIIAANDAIPTRLEAILKARIGQAHEEVAAAEAELARLPYRRTGGDPETAPAPGDEPARHTAPEVGSPSTQAELARSPQEHEPRDGSPPRVAVSVEGWQTTTAATRNHLSSLLEDFSAELADIAENMEDIRDPDTLANEIKFYLVPLLDDMKGCLLRLAGETSTRDAFRDASHFNALRRLLNARGERLGTMGNTAIRVAERLAAARQSWDLIGDAWDAIPFEQL